MPVNYEEEVLYSIEELSLRFNCTPDDIRIILTKKRLKKSEINDGFYLKKDDIFNLFDELFPALDISPYYYEIPEYLKSCTSDWAAALVKMYQEKFTCPASISPEQGDLLRTLVCNIAPNNIVEIGCYTGISTVWLAAGLEQIGSRGTVHSVDLFHDIMPGQHPSFFNCGYLKNPIEYAQKSVDSAKLSHLVKFYKMESGEMGEKVHEILNEPIDLLFIDGDHTIQGCCNDFRLFYPHVSVGGYIILHDIYPEFCGHYGPRYVIDKFIKKSAHFDLLEIKTSPINFGMAFIRKLGKDRKLELFLQLAVKLSKTGRPIWQKIEAQALGKFIRAKVLGRDK